MRQASLMLGLHGLEIIGVQIKAVGIKTASGEAVMLFD
jgi:hypothetical protein